VITRGIANVVIRHLSVHITQYESQFQNAVVDLWTKCGLIVPWNNPVEDIQRKLEFQPELFFIALCKGAVIGSVMVGYEGHRGWINYLAVVPRFQKRGYGKQLMTKAISELQKLGCGKVNLQVRTNNSLIIEFYQHLGFQIEDRINMGLRLVS
jgi:ribosomal protein S18 acetylase RimI-like enzyme